MVAVLRAVPHGREGRPYKSCLISARVNFENIMVRAEDVK